MKIIASIILLFSFVITAQEPVAWGGVTPLSQGKDQKTQFPNLLSLESRYTLFYQYVQSLEKSFPLSLQSSNAEGRTKSIVVGFDKERVTGGKFGDNCLWQYNLSARVILFELEGMTVLQAHPVGRSRNYVDDPKNCSEEKRDKKRDRFSI